MSFVILHLGKLGNCLYPVNLLVRFPYLLGATLEKKTIRKMFISVNKAAAFRHQGSQLVAPETPRCRRYTWYWGAGSARSPGCRQASTSGRLNENFRRDGKCATYACTSRHAHTSTAPSNSTLNLVQGGWRLGCTFGKTPCENDFFIIQFFL